MDEEREGRENEINHHIERLKESFLCAAARGGRIQECASLLDLGAEIEWHEYNEDTPLLAAVRNGHREVAALLMAYGANPSVRDRDGCSVMHIAASTGDEGMASLFSPNAPTLCLSTNNDGMTAIDIAVQKGWTIFAEHLNNLLYGTDEFSEEKDDTNHYILTEESADESDNSTHDVPDGNAVHELQGASYLVGSDVETTESHNFLEMVRGSSEHESTDVDIDVGIPNLDPVDNPIETIARGSSENESRHDIDPDDTNPDAWANQLRRMTQLAHTQSRDLYRMKYALNEIIQERDSLKNELALYRGDNDTLFAQKSLPELTSLEEQVKRSLDRIREAKELATNNLEEGRVCVICRENPKSVLLMSCRHLCVCRECGHLDMLVQCPLCRQTITEKIDVFS
ncbi:hypothetical protein ACHAWF_014452 [Thalassiosira exigua]